MRLERTSGGGKRRGRLPAVFFLTDPDRVPDPLGALEGLHPGDGVIFRGFGRPGSEALGRALARASKRRRLVFLVGADDALAGRCGAQGVHLPERLLWRARGLRRRRPGWLITGAAHSFAALVLAQRLKLDAVLVSAAFQSRSPSAGRALGPVRLGLLVRASRQAGGTPVYALGGVNAQTAPRLIGTGAAGLAAVEALASGRPAGGRRSP